jgi:site-specific DNA-methyltransferase (adenine-specific)
VSLPTPFYQDASCTIYNADCREILPLLDAESFVSVVTDPPYGLSFMGKKWDYEVPSVAIWEAVFAALKPGGHLLSFAGTRTQHRMAVNIEDAGFEIRDMIAWVYGSGFPKSLDVSKAIDKAAGAEREVVGKHKATVPNITPRPSDGDRYSHGDGNITAPATKAARQWSGYGSALKPALEPITMARKPIDGTLAANTLRHGCGGINVDGCRVETGDKLGGGNNSSKTDLTGKHEGWARPWMSDDKARQAAAARSLQATSRAESLGRWPANFIHDGSQEVVGLFPETGKSSGRDSRGRVHQAFTDDARQSVRDDVHEGFADSGNASRFFYCAKATDREILPAEEHPLFKESYAAVNNTHPTVKPVDLMRWLIRLVTPPGGVLLEPFMGSGTTLMAARLEGRRAVGIEINPEYCEIAANRLRQSVFAFDEVCV